jgi:hypothetical protein
MQSLDGGFTHVYSESEEKQLNAHGWKREEITKQDESAPSVIKPVKTVKAAIPVKNRPGRKPRAQ